MPMTCRASYMYVAAYVAACVAVYMLHFVLQCLIICEVSHAEEK